MHFAALFRRKQAKEKLHDAILAHVLLMKRVEGEQAETAVEPPKYVSAEASRDHSRASSSAKVLPAPEEDGSRQGTRRKGVLSLLPDSAAMPTQEVRVSRPSVIIYIIRSVQFVGLSYSICALQTREMCAPASCFRPPTSRSVLSSYDKRCF
jgi:hypothetical protein